MPVLLGSTSFVLASQVQVHQTCSVDLTWHRAVHSCQRCARAVLVASSVSLPPITQSSVERTTSRFCPAGVHMSTCVPASEIFTSSGRLSASRPQSAIIGSDFDNPALQNHLASSDNGPSKTPTESAWGPPNLPAPAANPHHPVHAAHLSRASYPPASSTTSVTISHVAAPATPPVKSTTSTAFHHFSPLQPSDKVVLNGSSADTVSMTTATIIPTVPTPPLVETKPEKEATSCLEDDKEPSMEDGKQPKIDILFEQSKSKLPEEDVATSRLQASSPDKNERDKSVTIVHEKEVVVEEPSAGEKKDGTPIDKLESSGEPEVINAAVVKKPKKEEPSAPRLRIGGSSDRPLPDALSTGSYDVPSESVKENDKAVRSIGSGYSSPKVLSVGPTSTSLQNDIARADSAPSHKPSQQQQTNREPLADTARHTPSTQVVRSPPSTVGSGGVGDVSPVVRTGGKVNNAMAGRTSAAVNSVHDLHVPGPPPRHPVSNGTARQRTTIPTFYYPQGVTRMSPEEVSCEMERARRELARLGELQTDASDRKTTTTTNTSTSELWIPHSNFGQVTRVPAQLPPPSVGQTQQVSPCHPDVSPQSQTHLSSSQSSPPPACTLTLYSPYSCYRYFFHIHTQALNCPLYWKHPIYMCSGGTSEHQPVQLSVVLKTWNQVITSCSDEAARFVYLMTTGKSTFLVQTDFSPLIQDILDSHPGLAFLQAAKDFHSRYVATVVARIFFNVNSSWSGRISLGELRHSNFLAVLSSLEDEVDINLVTQYFSYEHFYVIYCKFWELDDDHDLIISRSDLARHNNYALSERMINRIFSGTVTRGNAFRDGTMYYHDFVWFLLAEEDKLHPRSIEYWFRCMDLDGDGLLSMYELEYFYSEQMTRIEDMGIDPISFEDCLCQCLDMVKPSLGDKIRLSDLKQCGLCHVFFDTFFNLPKYLQHEQRDPFSNLRDIEEGLNNVSYWDRFAAEAYEMLVAVEGDHAEDDYPEGEDDLEEADDQVESPGVGKENGASSPNGKSAEVPSVGAGELTGPLQSPESDQKSKRKRATAVDVK